MKQIFMNLKKEEFSQSKSHTINEIKRFPKVNEKNSLRQGRKPQPSSNMEKLKSQLLAVKNWIRASGFDPEKKRKNHKKSNWEFSKVFNLRLNKLKNASNNSSLFNMENPEHADANSTDVDQKSSKNTTIHAISDIVSFTKDQNFITRSNIWGDNFYNNQQIHSYNQTSNVNMVLVNYNYMVPYNLQYSYHSPHPPNPLNFNHGLHSYPMENRMFNMYRRREDLMMPHMTSHPFFPQAPYHGNNATLYGKFLKDPIHQTNYFL